MEVTLQRTEPVAAIIERMQAAYGDLNGAQSASDPGAREAIYWFKELAANPDIVHEEVTTTTLVEIDPHDLPKLTPARQALIQTVRQQSHATVREIARAAGRDYKNVHNDLDILEAIGFVQSHRHGQDRIVQAFATELRIGS